MFVGSEAEAMLMVIKHFDIFSGRDIILGSAVIPLATALNSPMIDIEDWYPLVSIPGMTFKPSGRIQVILTYFNSQDDDMAHGQDTGEATNAPNLLQIRVLDADFSTTSVVKGPVEAFVIAQVGDLRKQSSVSKKSFTPTWDEILELPVVNGSEIIEITVKQSQLIQSTFIGRIRVPMNEVASAGETGMKKDYALVNQNFEFIERGNGHLNLYVKWIFDVATDEASKRRRAAKAGIFSSIASRFFRQPANAAESKVCPRSLMI
jgi:hypothetical protein